MDIAAQRPAQISTFKLYCFRFSNVMWLNTTLKHVPCFTESLDQLILKNSVTEYWQSEGLYCVLITIL